MPIGENEAGFTTGLVSGLTKSVPPILERMDEDRRNKELVDLIMPEVKNLANPDPETSRRAAGTIGLALMRAGKSSSDVKGYLELLGSLTSQPVKPTPPPQATPMSMDDIIKSMNSDLNAIKNSEGMKLATNDPDEVDILATREYAKTGNPKVIPNVKFIVGTVEQRALTQGYKGLPPGPESLAASLADVQNGVYEAAPATATKGATLYGIAPNNPDSVMAKDYINKMLARKHRAGWFWDRKDVVELPKRGK